MSQGGEPGLKVQNSLLQSKEQNIKEDEKNTGISAKHFRNMTNIISDPDSEQEYIHDDMKTLEEKSFKAYIKKSRVLKGKVKLNEYACVGDTLLLYDAQEALKEKDKEIEKLRGLMKELKEWAENDGDGLTFEEVIQKLKQIEL